MLNFDEWGVGQNLRPRPKSDRRFLGGDRLVVRSWNARFEGRTK